MTAWPNWLLRTFATGSQPVPANDVIRSAITLPAVLVVATAIGGPKIALFAGLSALLVILAERSGTTGQRLLKAGSALVAGILAMAVGPLSAGSGIAPLVTVLAFALFSAVLSSFGQALSFAGMQMLVQMSIAGGVTSTLAASDRLFAYAGGGAVALLAAWAQSALENTERKYRASLRAVEAARSAFESIPPLDADDAKRRAARWRVDALLIEASDLILTARPFTPLRRRRHRVLLRDLDRLSARVTRDFGFDLPKYASLTRHPASTNSILDLVEDRLRDRETWIFSARLVLCMGVAELVRQWSKVGHSYWIPLTVAIALKPDIGSVFYRSIQRVIGTAVGMIIGWIALFLSPGPVALVTISLLCAAIPYAVRRNYAWFCVVVTPLVLLLLDFGSAVNVDVLLQRLLNTGIGAAIVLVIGYAIWPQASRPMAQRDISRICQSLAEFLRMSGTDDVAIRRKAASRLEVSKEILALWSRIERSNGEPELSDDQARGWSDVVLALDRILMLAGQSDAPDGFAAQELSTVASRLLVATPLPDLHPWPRDASAKDNSLVQAIADLEDKISASH